MTRQLLFISASLIIAAVQIFATPAHGADCYTGSSLRPEEGECMRLNGLGGQTDYHMDMVSSSGNYNHFIYQCYANYPERTREVYGFCDETKTVVEPRRDDGSSEHPSGSCGSVISLESRTLADVIPLVGVPYRLWYSSDRVAGRATAFQLDIPVIGPTIPSGMTGASVAVVIAGRTFTQAYTAANSIYHFVWDGKAASNNFISFAAADVTVTHNYPSYSGDSPTHYVMPVGIPKLSIGLGTWGFSAVHFYEPTYGTLYLGDGAVRNVKGSALTPSGYRVASEDSSEAYIFDSSGYHVQTVDGFTGTPTLTITYDTSHRITSLVDAFGNLTTIQRNGSGVATAIVGPYGQITSLAFDSNGQLTSVTNPNSQTYSMGYSSTGGLLQTFTKPSGEVGTITYDSVKKTLATDSSTAGSSLSYTDSYLPQGLQERHLVSETSALGRQKRRAPYDLTTILKPS